MRINPRSYFWIILIIAFLIRLYKISLVKCIASDGIAYIDIAEDIIAGRGFNPVWPPLYPLFISFFLRCGFNPELSGQLVSVLFGTLTVGIIYISVKQIFSERTALISCLFAAFHPYLVRYSAEVLADSLFTFLITTVVFLGWLVIKKKNVSLVFLTGLFCGTAYLTKPEGIFLLPVISAWWIFSCRYQRYRRILVILISWLAFFAVGFPYLYSLRKETGRWTISQKESIVFSVALREEGYTDEFLNISPSEYLTENPKEFFKKTGSGLIKLFGRIPDAYQPVLFIFLVIGLVTGIREKKYVCYVSSFLFVYFIGYAIFNPGRRYLAGWVPVTLFFAACGIENAGGRIGKGRYLWLLVSITLLTMLPKTFDAIRPDGGRWKEAGLWIKNNSSGRSKVMCEDERTAFYANGEYVPLSDNRFGDVRYVVTDKETNFRKVYSTKDRLSIYET